MYLDRGRSAALLIAAGAVLSAAVAPLMVGGYVPLGIGVLLAAGLLVFQGLRTVRDVREGSPKRPTAD